MKAIQTVYNGYKFRSRLEARWAVFFDEININYQYEPQGFILNDGTHYLPDFYLPDTYLRTDNVKGVYLEIKHQHSDFDQINNFSMPIVIFHGDPMINTFYSDYEDGYDGGYETGSNNWDNCMRLWKCSICGNSKIEFLENNYDACINAKCSGRGDVIGLSYAASSARLARFEHGETP